MIKPGDTLEAAVWLDGRESNCQVKRFIDDAVAGMMKQVEEAGHRLLAEAVQLSVKRPGEDRVPEVPDHIQGDDVRLLVIEALVIPSKQAAIANESRFAADLEPDDFRRLCKITRKAYKEFMPHIKKPLTEAQCATIINDIGPEAARDALKSGEVNLSRVWH